MALLLERDSILQGMLMRNSVSFLHHAEREGQKVTITRNALLQRNFSKCDSIYIVCNLCLENKSPFFREV